DPGIQTDGYSLGPLLQAPESECPAPPLSTWGRNNHSVRDKRGRFTRYVDGTEELYDHDADPHEWTNLAGLQEMDEVRHRLAAQLPMPLPEPSFNEALYLA